MNKIIYIAGYGRSGSTILDILIGSLKGIQSLGEVGNLFRTYRREAQSCSCGSLPEACPFWSRILERGPLGSGREKTGRLEETRRRVEGGLGFLWLMNPVQRKRLRSDYCESTGRLLERLFEETKSTHLVDSTKSAYPFAWRALALQRLCGLNVQVIHLFRDVRSVMTSKITGDNRELRFGDSGRMRSSAGLRGLAGWLMGNAAALLTGLFLRNGTYWLVQYEDLVVQPEQEIRLLGQVLEIDVRLLVERIRREDAFESGHLMAGNRMAQQRCVRFRKTVRTGGDLPFHLKFFCGAFGLPLYCGLSYLKSHQRRALAKAV